MTENKSYSNKEYIINLENVSKKYIHPSFQNQLVLKDINLSISPGEFLLVMGSSGSGKTTLLNIILGLLQPTTGRISINNSDINHLNDNQLSELRQTTFGFVFQQSNLLDELNALENVELPLVISKQLSPQERTLKAENLLNKVHLLNKKHSYPDELSGGEKQLIAIARALISDSSIILADEPTANLDSLSAKKIMDTFHNLNDNLNITIIMVRGFDCNSGFSKRLCIKT